MVTIITDVRVPAREFPLGRILEDYPDVEIELEQLVPTQTGVMPLFWVDSGSEGAVAETLTNDPLVEDITLLTRTPTRVLYSVDWSPDVDALVRTLVDLGVDVLTATGTAESWDFRLQFRKQTDLERFRRACQRQDIDVELLELYNPLMPPEKGPLTSEQHDILATAYESGYWDVPRKTTQEELAELIGVND
ncbi:bacterio-opsin activator domain-containing protein [Halogeometricum luteum]|uniref:Helix-turn-helix domain-containing protein n=1 Tax=Halogeometricum luteum TaxID=2950537 RepID=A0ABU2G2F9_9EURY|nr:bacterio-opsin activator domain-containing protein [Halogeometricum sp. S3BR5-2]MDS0294947.1 helix-turn-helix domain-containing protein [Halogeometricum sp. S3BR5-2]